MTRPVHGDAAARSAGQVWTHGAGADAVVHGAREGRQIVEQRRPVQFATLGRHGGRRHRALEQYPILEQMRLSAVVRRVGHDRPCAASASVRISF